MNFISCVLKISRSGSRVDLKPRVRRQTQCVARDRLAIGQADRGRGGELTRDGGTGEVTSAVSRPSIEWPL